MDSYGQMQAAEEPPAQALTRGLLVRGVGLLRMNNLMAQGVRFVITGVVVSVVYIAVTTVLAEVSHLRFQVALVIGWCSAVTVHFTLQRTFVWAHEGFALPFARQLMRYGAVAGSQLGVTAASTTVLPPLLHVPDEAVYLATAFVLTLFNFIVFRHGVFHPRSASEED